MKRPISWSEIPVSNFERALKFYSAITETKLQEMHMEGMKYGMFPYDNQSDMVGGGMVQI